MSRTPADSSPELQRAGLATRSGHHAFLLLNLALWWRRVFGDSRGLTSAAEPCAAGVGA